MSVALVPVKPADAALHARWLADPEVARFRTARYPLSGTTIAASLAGDERTTQFTVVAGGERIGYAALRRSHHVENRGAEADLLLGARRGEGLGTAAARALCAYGFGTLGLHRVSAWVVAGNAAALRTGARAGFADEGTSRHRLYRDGRYLDCVLLGLLAGEWRP